MSEKQQAMWSAVHRQNRHIFEEGDTNMLVEAWHHVLKGKFLNGKRNRRLDTLICLLHDDVLRHYALRYHRQLHGFEGRDLEAVERVEIAQRAQDVDKDRIKATGDGIYEVTALSTDGIYIVNTESVSCTCFAFPRIQFCKHLAAVELHFPTPAQQQPLVLTAAMPADRPLTAAMEPSSRQNAPESSADIRGAALSTGPTLDDVTAKMRRFLARAAVTTQRIDQSVLDLLDSSLTDALGRTEDNGVLPKAVAIPPNVKSATETARILPRHKTKRKLETLRQKEPYSGGERSGKKAKQDALRPPPVSVVQRSHAAGPAAAAQAALTTDQRVDTVPTQYQPAQYHAAAFWTPRGHPAPLGYVSSPYPAPNGAQQQFHYAYPTMAADTMPPVALNPSPYLYHSSQTPHPPPSYFYSQGHPQGPRQ